MINTFSQDTEISRYNDPPEPQTSEWLDAIDTHLDDVDTWRVPGNTKLWEKHT